MAQKKTLSAQKVVADIRAGATNDFLMKKYELSENGLQSLFQKLVNAKILTHEDLDCRVSEQIVVEEVCEVNQEEPSLEPSSDNVQAFDRTQKRDLPKSSVPEPRLQESERPSHSDKTVQWYDRGFVVLLLLTCLFPLGLYALYKNTTFTRKAKCALLMAFMGVFLMASLISKGGRQSAQKEMSGTGKAQNIRSVSYLSEGLPGGWSDDREQLKKEQAWRPDEKPIKVLSYRSPRGTGYLMFHGTLETVTRIDLGAHGEALPAVQFDSDISAPTLSRLLSKIKGKQDVVQCLEWIADTLEALEQKSRRREPPSFPGTGIYKEERDWEDVRVQVFVLCTRDSLPVGAKINMNWK